MASTRTKILIGVGGPVLAAIVSGIFVIAKKDPAPGPRPAPISASKPVEANVVPSPTGPRKITVQVPNDGNLPEGNVDVTIADADARSGESVWLGIRNQKDPNGKWYLYPCGERDGKNAKCRRVTV